MALRRLILDVLQACLRGDIKLIKWLLEHKVRMDIKQNSGHTPISAACYNGHMEVVEYLMNIDPTLYTKESMIAMQAAAGQKHTDIVQYLATFAMPLKSEDDFLQLFLDKTTDIYQWLLFVFENNLNHLQTAVLARRMDRVKTLLKEGLPLDAQNKQHSLVNLARLENAIVKSVSLPLVTFTRQICKPMSMTNIEFLSKQTQKSVVNLLLMQEVLLNKHSAELPVLPTEIWLHLVSFVRQ